MEECIDIVMGTYCGEKYLACQIESIIAQSYPHLRLLVRDDVSSDGTVRILQYFVEKYPEKIILFPSDKRLGVRGNFSYLLGQTKASYVMLSDQDDFWYSDKVAKTMTKMRAVERQTCQGPVLIHSDLQVVDQNLNPIHPSFWKYAGLSPYKGLTLNRLAVQNTITGCTMMINRPLLNCIGEIPNEAIMHDWWIALIAAAFGKIDFIEEPTLAYRQHHANTLGARRYSILAYLKNCQKSRESMSEGSNNVNGSLSLNSNFLQIKKFLYLFYSELNSEQKKMLQSYLNISSSDFLKRLYLISKYRFFKNGWMRNLLYLFD